MVLMPVLCPHCHSDHVIKGGKTKAGQQRYKCQNTACPHYSFQLDLLYKGRAPAITEPIVDMSLNSRGIRDTARVLKISPTTVINALKKKRGFQASSDKSASWFPLTQNFANSAMVRSTISWDFETMIDVRLKRPNQ
jgi:transposase-like protein